MNTPEKTQVAILASGSGTTAESVIRATQAIPDLSYEVALVVTNNPDAGILDRVERLRGEYGLTIDAAVVNKQLYPDDREVITGCNEEKYSQTRQESARILEYAWEYDIGLILLAGYLRKVQGPLLEEYGALPDHKSVYEARMLNTHPGPLPDTKGMFGRGVHKHMAGLQKGGKAIWSAQTLHVVSAEYDQGGTIAINNFPVYPGDPVDKIEETAQAVEKAHIATDVDRFLLRQAHRAKVQREQIPFTD